MYHDFVISMCFEPVRGKLLKYALLRPRCSICKSSAVITKQ